MRGHRANDRLRDAQRQHRSALATNTGNDIERARVLDGIGPTRPRPIHHIILNSAARAGTSVRAQT